MMLVFQLAFTGKLARRCQVFTKAELFKLRSVSLPQRRFMNRNNTLGLDRFGDGKQGNAARIVTAALSIFCAILMVAYFAEGKSEDA